MIRLTTSFEDSAASFGEELANRVRDILPNFIVIATVESVDEEAKTLDAVVDNDKVFSDISLDVFPNGGNSVYLIPKVGSMIILGFIEGFAEDPFVIKTTAIEKLIISNEQSENSTILVENDYIEVIRGESIWRIEDGKISLSAELTEFNGGANDGMIKIHELTEKLNALVADFNAHNHSIPSGAVLVAAQGGVSNPTPIQLTAPTPTTDNFVESDYENTAITQ